MELYILYHFMDMVGIMLAAFNANAISWNDGRYSINRKYSTKPTNSINPPINCAKIYLRYYHFMNFMCFMCFIHFHTRSVNSVMFCKLFLHNWCKLLWNLQIEFACVTHYSMWCNWIIFITLCSIGFSIMCFNCIFSNC